MESDSHFAGRVSPTPRRAHSDLFERKRLYKLRKVTSNHNCALQKRLGRSVNVMHEDHALSSQPFLNVGFTHFSASWLLVIMPFAASYASLPS